MPTAQRVGSIDLVKRSRVLRLLESSSGFSGLLDLVGLVASAYSIGRKLKNSYAGSAFRLRRSTDDVEQDIGFLGSNIDANAIATFLGGASGFFSKVYDQSGNGRDLLQATKTLQPLYVPNVQNGRPSCRFDGVDDFLKAAFTLNLPCTIYHTFINKTFVGNTTILDGGSGTINRIRFYTQTTSGKYFIESNTTNVFTTAGPATGTPAISRIVGISGANSSLTFNNNVTVSGNIGNTNPGGLIVASAADIRLYTNQDFFENIIFASDKTGTSDDATVWANTNAYYNIF